MDYFCKKFPDKFPNYNQNNFPNSSRIKTKYKSDNIIKWFDKEKNVSDDVFGNYPLNICAYVYSKFLEN